MCVIIHGLKKKHVRRAEVQQAMKSNSAGFFLAELSGDGKSRKTIRTMDERQALEFFDRIGDDSQFVMHARIPSRGTRMLENVHGWEEDRIIFCHNMTLTSLEDMMKRAKWDRTDSEFFFRRIFMPFYRGFGEEAYKDGRLHPDIENLVEHFIGTCNKFCFVMPDNRVLRFGSWVNESDRREDGEIAFWASNSSYRPFVPAWPQKDGGAPGYGAGFHRDIDWDSDEYDYYGYGRRTETEWARKADPGKTADGRFDGSVLRDVAGDKAVLRLALADLVSHNLVETRRLSDGGDPDAEDAAMEAVDDYLMPEAFTGETWTAVSDGLRCVEKGDRDSLELLLSTYAEAAEPVLDRMGNEGRVGYYPSRDRIEKGLETAWIQFRSFCRLMNLTMNFKPSGKSPLAVAFVMGEDKKGNPTMERVRAPDLIDVGSDMTEEESAKAVYCVVSEINAPEEPAEAADPKTTRKGDAA